LSRLATTMFNKTSDYLYGELTSTLDDYRLLENMNRATITKYSDMKLIAANVSKSMGELNEKCKNYFFFDILTTP
jgi:biogenesis of lysosome-related organelles complex 1 subunit 2